MNHADVCEQVIERDRHCLDCGAYPAAVHHIVGRAHFGKHGQAKCWALKNLCLLCPECHAKAHTHQARVKHLTFLKVRYNYDYAEKPWSEYI